MSGLLSHASVLQQGPGEDISSRLEPIQAHDLKNGSYVLDDSTGVPGVVSNLKMSKTGKHGHAKFTYSLFMPFSGRSSAPMHPGGDRLLRPVMKKMEYEVVDYMDDVLTVLDEDDSEKTLTLPVSMDDKSKDTELAKKIKAAFEDGKIVFVKTMVGPVKKGSEVHLVEMPDDFTVKDE